MARRSARLARAPVPETARLATLLEEAARHEEKGTGPPVQAQYKQAG
jgi:hypothetical protein